MQPDPAGSDRRVWAYDFNNDAWTSLGDEGAPPVALDGAAAATDPENGRMVLFGGAYEFPDSLSGKTWAYGYADKTWTELISDESPSPRSFHNMVYDAFAGKMVLFGGVTGEWDRFIPKANYSDELWLFDPGTDQWSQVTPIP